MFADLQQNDFSTGFDDVGHGTSTAFLRKIDYIGIQAQQQKERSDNIELQIHEKMKQIENLSDASTQTTASTQVQPTILSHQHDTRKVEISLGLASKLSVYNCFIK